MDDGDERLSRAISASSRRQILHILSQGEATVKTISTKLHITMSLASRHLKLLYDLGFLQVRKEFPYKYYSLKIKELSKLLDVYETVISKL